MVDLAGASVAWQQRVIISHGIDTALSKLCVHHATASGIETWHVQVTESAMHILHVIRPPFARPLPTLCARLGSGVGASGTCGPALQVLSHVEINKVALCTPGVIRAACALLGGTDKVGTTRHAAQTADTMQLTTRAVLGRSNEATTAATPLVPSGGRCAERPVSGPLH